MTQSINSVSSNSITNPKVLIVGAGLGGLTLAILFEKAGIDYEIFEKSSTLQIPGGATSLSPSILQALDQMGLLKDIMKFAKPTQGYEIFKEKSDGTTFSRMGNIDVSFNRISTGYDAVIMHGSELHALLMSRVPKHKILFGKRVLSITQEKNNGVLIRTSDGATHQGEILVGSDGTHSAVRQSLYKNMTRDGKLPTSDTEQLKPSHVSFLGITNPMSPELIPSVASAESYCSVVIGYKKPQTWRCFTIAGNRICWRVDIQIPASNRSSSDAFRNSEWGSEAIQTFDPVWRDFKVPVGPNGQLLTIGELMDATPKDQISKTVFEEKMFSTWHYCRTVLIGDACHKMLPNAGKAIVNAMLDAVVLANELYEIGDNATPDNIANAFKEYYKNRFPYAKIDFETSQRTAQLIAGQSKKDVIIRKIVYYYISTLFKPKANPKVMAYRPQVNFLPFVPNRGEGELLPQKESSRCRRTYLEL
ncbi:hypothetical protein BGZ76_008787 [Entomortierella beljakovae]|nr:hypothetical protein BGZ76_008787 [Entomortierella beljakovae]